MQQNTAALQLAEVNLSHTTIRSPIEGIVVSRNVDVGQTVAASLQAPTIFIIANDLTRMQVIASVDQADVGAINSSNVTSFTVDAYPDEVFRGGISQIRLDAQNVQNVVTYNVVIDVDNSALELKPGMTANLTFTIAGRDGVLKVPNAALRFSPTGVLASSTAAVLPGQSRIVWVLGPNGHPQSRTISLGITDGVNAEVTEGNLKEGEQIILGQTVTAGTNPQATQRPPGFGGSGR